MVNIRMIDLHSHILPGIDDGAADLYESIEMAKIAVESGVTAMVATPHCNIPGMFRNYYDEDYIEVFRELERALEEEGIPLTLYAGMEVYMTSEVPDLLAREKLLTINGGHYILVEFSFDEDPGYVNHMLEKVSKLGLCPVIAHAERYTFVQRDLQLVYYWRKKGYQVQINKASFLGRFGRRARYAAYRLLNHNLITAIASDTHSPYQRTPYMADAFEELAEEYSRAYLQVLFEENPKRICEDKPVVSFELRPFEEEDEYYEED